jgi:protein disulfide-isomerase A6
MGVKGFPTLKTVRPAMKKGGRPVVEDYNGERSAGAIVNAVVGKINNHVAKVTDKDVEEFVEKEKKSPKAILFSEKGTVSALLKSVAIDFLGTVRIGQVRNKEKQAVDRFGVEKFPTLVLLPGGDQNQIVYDGKMEKEAIVAFLSQAGAPNQGQAPAEEKKAKKSTTTKSSKATDDAKPGSDEDTEQKPIVNDTPEPTATPTPIPAIATRDDLVAQCLTITEKSHTCVLALVPSTHGEQSKEALTTLANLAFKYIQGNRHLFPFFEVAKENEAAAKIVKELGLTGDVEIIAINARRKWWRQYKGADFGVDNVERWIDAIRMGEGEKNKLPEALIVVPEKAENPVSVPAAEPEETPETVPESATVAATEEPSEEITPEAQASETVEAEATETTEAMPVDPEVETETAAPRHEEL